MFRLGDEAVAGVAASIDEGVRAGEQPPRELAVAQGLPHRRDGVALGRVGRRVEEGDGRRHPRSPPPPDWLPKRDDDRWRRVMFGGTRGPTRCASRRGRSALPRVCQAAAAKRPPRAQASSPRRRRGSAPVPPRHPTPGRPRQGWRPIGGAILAHPRPHAALEPAAHHAVLLPWPRPETRPRCARP